jgi:hypothetical protein
MEEKIRIFSDSQAIQSERASDFDVYSAYGEVLDNSIEAEARKIKIKFKTSIDKKRSEDNNKGKNFLHIDLVAFGDDGIGMDQFTLHHCLQLGYSSRYGKRTGIGRFGVGMTKGAISQCKKIEVYSKQTETKDWLYTYFDIDEIELNNGATINFPTKKEIPNEFNSLVGKESGTLIIWSKIDRQEKSANEIINESKIWIGRTFRKFIFNNINFFIDSQEIKAIDPLYLNPSYTEFPDDPKATFWGEDTFYWEIDDKDVLNQTGLKKSLITIRYSLLPQEFLKRGGGRRLAGKDEENLKRYVHRNEGISILRKNREVRDPEFDIPYWKPKLKDIDRFWGCEICFDPELDNWFQVKNIKRGAAPLRELREELQNRINNVTKTLVTEIQTFWDSLEDVKPPQSGVDISPQHGKSAKIAVSTIIDTKPKDNFSKKKNPENEIDYFVKARFGELSEDEKKSFVEYFSNNLITIIERPSNSANFFEVTHFGNGKKNIAYNTNHIFNKKYFQVLENLMVSGETNNSLNHKQILILVDLLLIAYSIAESHFDEDASYQAKDFFEDLMFHWGKALRDLLKTWEVYE